MISLSNKPSTVSLSPFTTCNTPSGRPASFSNSARNSEVDGHRSDGFRIIALPADRAGAIFHNGIMAGKLNGVMPATTPKGWRMAYRSMPGPAESIISPFSIAGAPMQTSTTSSPR